MKRIQICQQSSLVCVGCSGLQLTRLVVTRRGAIVAYATSEGHIPDIIKIPTDTFSYQTSSLSCRAWSPLSNELLFINFGRTLDIRFTLGPQVAYWGGIGDGTSKKGTWKSLYRRHSTMAVIHLAKISSVLDILYTLCRLKLCDR
jgi:hypothetical protein